MQHGPILTATPLPRHRVCLAAVAALLALAGSLLSQTPAAKQHAQAAQRRAQGFLRGRSGTATASAAESLAEARQQHLQLAAKPMAAPLTSPWSPVGPLQVVTPTYGLITGRITSVAVDPSDATGNTVYVGSTGGGVWKSTNAAGPTASASFAPLTDALTTSSMAVGALTVQPGATGVVLAGTGDPNDAADSYYGQGLLRSADRGNTWTVIGANQFAGEGFAGFAWSTSSPQFVVAAVSQARESGVVGDSKTGVRGLYYSTNAGVTWTLATIQDGSTVVQSKSTSYASFRGNAATAVVWNPVRKKFYAAIRYHGYYESADGVTFTRLASQPGAGLTTTNCPARTGDYGLQSCPIFRGALAAQPASGDLFAWTVDASNLDQGLWQDTCGLTGSACTSSTVSFATQINDTPSQDAGAIDAGDYNLALAAVPAATALSATDTLLFAGAGDLYRCSLAGGCTLRNTTNATTGCAAPAGVAPSQHAIAWQANLADSSSPRIFLGNDGGLWRSLDGVKQQSTPCSADDATHFDNLNGGLGSLAEVVSVASHPTNASVLLVALGANGSAGSSNTAQAAGLSPWLQLGNGESGFVGIDQSTGRTWMVQSGAGVQLHTCTNGTACSATDFSGLPQIGLAQVNNDESLTDPPVLLDPGLNTNVLVGTCRVWRGPVSGGSAWSSSDQLSRVLAGPLNPVCDATDAMIRSLGAGGTAVTTSSAQNSGSPVLYAGLAGVADGGSTFGGHMYVNTSARTAAPSTVWTDITGSSVTNDSSNAFNAGNFDISSIAVDGSDPTGQTVYATVMGFGYPHLYRSVNAGATWLNVTSNLPNAPANSVVVDPVDPRIVYVALDTGVYVTQDVTACTPAGGTANCWSVLGTGLPATPAVTLSISQAAGMLRVGTYGRGIWQVPLLSSGTAMLPVATPSPATLTFAAQAVGTTSAAQTVTVTNTGNAVLVISGLTASTGFAETDTCTGSTLTVGASCTVKVTFSPLAVGPASGMVQINANVAGGYTSIALNGTGTGVPQITLSPTAIAFATTAVNATSAAQTVTVTNSGTGPATLQTPTASADFAVVSTTCGATLGPGATCTVAVVFSPLQAGPYVGTLTVTDATGKHTAALSGTATGTASVALTPTSYNFSYGFVGSYARGTTLTLTNTGTASTTITAPAVTSGDFRVTPSCPATLSAGASCSILVVFQAAAAGPRTGSYTVQSDVGSVTATFTGIGNPPLGLSMAPASLTFGTTAVGAQSAPQSATVTNSGSGNVNIGVFSVLGADFAIQNNACPGGFIPFRVTCSVSVLFSPTADGPRNGVLQFTDGLNVTHSVLLSGTGKGTPNVTLSATAVNFGTVAVGASSAPQTVTVSNTGTAAIGVTGAAITGDFAIAGTTCGTSLAAGSACTLTVLFQPTLDGPRTGTLTFTDALAAHAIALAGTGQGTPNVVLAPSSLTFDSTQVGAASATRTATATNSGTAAAQLAAPTVTGDYAVRATTCAASLAAGASCTVTLAFTPKAEGPRNGVLTLADAVATHTVNLSGNGLAGDLAVSPTAVTFPDTAVAATSAAQTVTVTNTGTGPLTVSAATVTGDFAATGNCTASPVAPGKTCTVAVTFTPTATGARTGTLTLTSDSGGAPGTATTVALTGNGKTPFNIVLQPTAADFGTVVVGSSSAVVNITISNTGNTAGAIAGVSITGDFSIKANTCGATLQPQTGCTVSVVFTPTATGARTGTLTVTDDAGTQTATLTGTGAATATDTLAPLSLTFTQQVVGTTSAAQTVTVTNSGDVPLTLLAAQILSGDFTLGAGCAPTLPAHSSCALPVTFVPTAPGTRIGVLQVSDVQRVQTVTLTGSAVAGPGVSLAPASLTFGTTGVGVSAAPQTVTLTNNGGVPLQLSAISVTGDFGIVAGSSTCSTTAALPVGATCTMAIAFVPQAAGARTGALTVTSNAPTQTVNLLGTGLDFSLAANGATTVTIASGGSAVFPLLLRPAVNTGDPVTFTCTGAPTNSKCTVTSQYSDLSATGTVTVTVLTGVKASRITGTLVLLPLLGLLPWAARRRSTRGLCLAAVACALLLGSAGCGTDKVTALSGTGTGGGGGGTGTLTTPAGSYNLTASASAAGITHSVNLTLIVQ